MATQTNQLSKRTDSLYDALDGIFDLKKHKGDKGWEYIRSHISAGQVKQVYKFIEALWPESLDIQDYLPDSSDGKLRSIYIGNMHPSRINQRIARYALYTDQIVLSVPFLNPKRLVSDFSPMENPGKYLTDTFHNLAFMLEVRPWVETGKVVLIPNPLHYDPSIIEFVFNPDRERAMEAKFSERRAAKKNVLPEDAKEDAIRNTFLRLPENSIIPAIREQLADLSDEEQAEWITLALRMKKEDRFYLKRLPEDEEGEVVIGRMGAPTDVAEILCQLSGCYMYTDNSFQWEDILSTQANREATANNLWAPLTNAFQTLDFKFLDNVDAHFASRIAAEGKMESFRSYIRDIWQLAGAELQWDTREKIRNFAKELGDRHHQAEAEWHAIDQQLIDWSKKSSIVTVSALTSGKMHPAIPIGGFCFSGISQLIGAHYKRTDFKRNVPMAVFIELSR